MPSLSARDRLPILGALCVALAAGQALSVEVHRYTVRSGIVEYEISGSQTGAETLYFDRWGMREARYRQSETKVMGVSIRRNEPTLLDGEWTYGIDLDRKTGTKIESPFMKELIEKAASEGKSMVEIGEEILARSGGKKVGSEEILGKKCDVWEVSSLKTRSWVWNGITLRTEAELMGTKIVVTATKVLEDPEIPAGKLEIPEGVEIREGVGPAQQLRSIQEKIKGR